MPTPHRKRLLTRSGLAGLAAAVLLLAVAVKTTALYSVGTTNPASLGTVFSASPDPGGGTVFQFSLGAAAVAVAALAVALMPAAYAALRAASRQQDR